MIKEFRTKKKNCWEKQDKSDSDEFKNFLQSSKAKMNPSLLKCKNECTLSGLTIEGYSIKY